MNLITIARLHCLCITPGSPASGIATSVAQLNTIYRADGQAQLTAGAGVCNDGVHTLIGAQDGIGRANLDAKRATNAPALVNAGNSAGGFYPVVRVQRQLGAVGNYGESAHTFLPAGRALVNSCTAIGNGFGVMAAIGVAAASALRLGQGIVNRRNKNSQRRGWLYGCCIGLGHTVCKMFCLEVADFTLVGLGAGWLLAKMNSFSMG